MRVFGRHNDHRIRARASFGSFLLHRLQHSDNSLTSLSIYPLSATTYGSNNLEGYSGFASPTLTQDMAALLALRNLKATPTLVPLSRTLVNRAAARPVPSPRGTIDSPAAFLTAIGRSAETKLNVETWDELWKQNGESLRKAGLSVKDRRYILWSMEKYRLGEDPADFAHPPKPRKKIRGWGPKIQNGKVNRSRARRSSN
ncbi:hypothetical protein BC629DRAFT_1495592 [Irpex lacteus]|nr:hypothetical protein BC629DRAFT_1495592 [Irpex lacteus]